MSTIKLTQHFEVNIGGELKEAGSRVTPVEITAASGIVYEVRTTVATEYIAETLWTTGTGNVDDFDFLWFESDEDVLLILRNDNSTDEFLLFEVKADVPLVLSSTECRASDGGTTPVGDGSGSGTVTTLETVDQIVVQNNSTAGSTATVRLVLIT